jgi:hypothetical protein
MCTCGDSDCAETRGRLRNRNVVIHVVAEQASVERRGTTPGFMTGADGLIPPEAVAELAKSATLQPLIVPAAAESRYTPSTKLAEFVRCRDLTCRAPGCDVPAINCDIDHTIPFADGGPTHPSNVKCLCRKHRLLSGLHPTQSATFPPLSWHRWSRRCDPISRSKRCRRNRGFGSVFIVVVMLRITASRAAKTCYVSGSVIGCWLGCRRYLPPQGKAPAAM